MLEAVGEAVLFARNRTRKDLDNDRMLILSIVKSVELIGEAATRISKEGRIHIRKSLGQILLR